MSAPGFTQGPLDWTGTPQTEGGAFHCYLIDPSGRKIATLWGPSAEKIANAHLFSAAPDLYDQVELFVRCIEYEIKVSEKKGDDEGARLKSFTLAMAKAALAKARGEQS